jgi:hypothetical protein
MKHLLLAAGILLFGTTAQAQTSLVRYVSVPHANIHTQPANGYDTAAHLEPGDSVTVVTNPPTDNPDHIPAASRQQFTYVLYPSYRDARAGKGWLPNYVLTDSRARATQQPAQEASLQATTVRVPSSKVTRTTATGSRSAGAGRTYQTGPRGGCFYYSPSGAKVYVDHSYCK